MKYLRSNRTAWVEYTQILANLIVPLAFLITALAFYLQVQETRRDATARQIEIFYSEGLASAQGTMLSIWIDQDLSVLDRIELPRKAKDALVQKVIETSDVGQMSIWGAIVSITSYFDRAEKCIEKGKCDSITLNDQLGEYARNFSCLYSGEIERIKDTVLLKNLGDGLTKFSSRAGSCTS